MAHRFVGDVITFSLCTRKQATAAVGPESKSISMFSLTQSHIDRLLHHFQSAGATTACPIPYSCYSILQWQVGHGLQLTLSVR